MRTANVTFWILTIALAAAPTASLWAQTGPTAAAPVRYAPAPSPKPRTAGVTERQRVATPKPADNSTPEGRLKMAGLPIAPAGILNWWKGGFQHGHDLSQIPELPKEKTQFGVDAIEILGAQRSTESVSALVEVVAGRLPLGLSQLMEMDIMVTVSDEREPFRSRVLRIYRYNAVVALGLIGDTRALSVALAAFQAEESPSAKIQFAQSLALLGSADGVDFLVQLINSDDKKLSYAGARMFFFITGQDFGLTLTNSNERRKSVVPKYSAWWKANRAAFKPDPTLIRARQNAPQAESRGLDDSLRGRLKMCSNYADFKQFEKIRGVRQALYANGSALNKDLEKIVHDPMEDVDVRMEALNAYYEINRHTSQGRSLSRKFFARCNRLTDREVTEKAKNLITTINADYPNDR